MNHEICECDISRQLRSQLSAANLHLEAARATAHYWHDLSTRYKAQLASAVSKAEGMGKSDDVKELIAILTGL